MLTSFDGAGSRRPQRVFENERRLALARLQAAIRERMAAPRARSGPAPRAAAAPPPHDLTTVRRDAASQ